MNWRNNLKNIFKSKELSEAHFILGIDLGDSTSAICYYDIFRKNPEIIDISGGYGKVSVPTTLQYIHDTKEWIFGEYAVLNDGAGSGGTMLNNMIDRLGTKTYLEIGTKLEPLTTILSIYIKELLASCKNINPKAEIAGIVVSVPDYMPVEAKNELLYSFAQIGYDKKIVDFISHRECILTYHYQNRKVEKENILILDYGSRELRGGIYETGSDGGGIKVNIASYFFDEGLGTRHLDEKIRNKFIEIYKENAPASAEVAGSFISENISGQINTFAYQHKDAIFQKHLTAKGMRIYYNFAYPPFYYVFGLEDAENIIKPFRQGMTQFLNALIKNNTKTMGSAIDFSDISTVVCTGGGFEMLWARELVQDILPDSNVFLYKNSKAINACGAAIIAAGKLGAIAERPIYMDDTLQVRDDIGIIIEDGERKKFFPIIERGSFWWQNKKRIKLIVKSEADELSLSLHKRDESGDLSNLGRLTLNDLPKRPRGATQIDLNLEYIDNATLKARLTDNGFGCFFSGSGLYTEELFEF